MHLLRTLIAESDAEGEDQKNRKDEDPEDDFRLSQKFAHARERQFQERMKTFRLRRRAATLFAFLLTRSRPLSLRLAFLGLCFHCVDGSLFRHRATFFRSG